MKRVPALISALIITALLAMCMLAIGVNALLNTNTVPVQNSPRGAAAAGATAAANAPGTGSLQDQLRQSQEREAQLQSQLDATAQQLSDANEQVQQLQGVLGALQERGVITITPDGRILIRRSGG